MKDIKYTYMYTINGHTFYHNSENNCVIRDFCQDRWIDTYHLLKDRLDKEKETMMTMEKFGRKDGCSYKRSEEILKSAKIIRIHYDYYRIAKIDICNGQIDDVI